MERYRPASQPDSLICAPLDMAIAYGEQVAPTRFSPSELHSTILYESSRPVDSSGTQLSGQIYPPPEKDREVLTAPVLAKVAVPYDAQEKQLKHLLRRIRRANNEESQPSDQLLPEEEWGPSPVYPTAFGNLSFPQLLEKMRKYTAYALNTTYHLHPADVEDGLQAGYAHLWKRLQDDPDLLKDKSMAWIGKGIIYRGLHAIRGDWRYQQHIVAEEGRSSTDRRGKHSPESRAADMRTDIHRAIAEVAQQIITTGKGKRVDHEIWALYGLTMLHVSASEASRLFGVREQSMQAAYKQVRVRLQVALPHYAPSGEIKPMGKRGPEKLPQQDMAAIRQGNSAVSDEVYRSVEIRIESLQADTQRIDQMALAGIRQGISISTQARTHQMPQYQMQRAYKRVHLMIGAERDPTVRMLRPERRNKYEFKLTSESAKRVEVLANELLGQPKSYEKLVALHAHISNLAISTTAKHFNIPTSTLRYYGQQIGRQLQTPAESARKQKSEQQKVD